MEQGASIASRLSTPTDRHPFMPSADASEFVATLLKAFVHSLMKQSPVPRALAACHVLMTPKNEFSCTCLFTHATLRPNDSNDLSEMSHSPHLMSRCFPIHETTKTPQSESTE